MRIAEHLAAYVDHWYGDSRMRMLPDEPLAGDASAAALLVVAGGNAVSLTYDWYEAESGRQEGLLILTDGASPGAVDGVWLDSWHQHPHPMRMAGHMAEASVSVAGNYGEGDETGGWHIHLHFDDPDTLIMSMDNEMAVTGRYEVVRAVWGRV